MISSIKVEQGSQGTIKAKVKLLIKCFFLSLLIKVIAVLILRFASKTFAISILTAEKVKLTDYYSLEISLLLIILAYPVLEEFAFRGWFSRNKILISVSLTALIFYFLYLSIYKWIPGLIPNENNKLLFISSCLITALFILYIKASGIQQFITSNHKLLVIISILAFSAIHLINYNIKELNIDAILAITIIISPHLFVGYMLTYVRTTSGLPWSIALHVINNSIILLRVVMGHADI